MHVAPGVTTSRRALSYNARMNRTKRQWVAYAWIATLAILFNALMPAVAHALAASAPASSSAQMEVCTAMGMEMMSMPMAPPANADHGSASDKLMKGMTHCGYCVTHGGSFGLLPQVNAVFAVLGGHDVFPPLFYSASRPLFQWSLAQPRAPPFPA